MHGNLGKALILALATWVVSLPLARAQEARKPAQAEAPAAKAAARPSIDPDGSRMKRILEDWAKQSAKLRTMDVNIRLVESGGKWGSEEFQGRAMFKAPNKAWLDFSKVVVQKGGDPKNPVKKLVHDNRVVCTGKEIWQYETATHEIFIHELGKEEQERALQEGPLPFLFNFRAEEARKRYRMLLYQAGQNTYTILVIPLLAIDRESFHHAFIQLDSHWLLPTRIELTSPEGKETREYDLSDYKVNKPVMEQNFVGRKIANWSVRADKIGGAPAVGRDQRGGAAPRQAQQGRPVR
jgi:TIGR03009 family protein